MDQMAEYLLTKFGRTINPYYGTTRQVVTDQTMYTDIGDLIESQPVSKEVHDWQQSTVEAQHMIKALTVENQTVLDPFGGSATTGIAALQLGRRFIGIEINEVHYSNAAQRLAKFTVSTRQ